MNGNAVKKTVLLSLAGLLLCIYIVQISLGSRSKTRTLTVKEEISSVSFYTGTNPESAVVVKKTGEDEYRVSNADGSEEYDAVSYSASSLIDGVSEIHILGEAAKLTEANEERFGLDPASRITVQLNGSGGTIRTVYVGKNSSAGSQCYLTVDGSNQILICSSTLHTVYSATMDSIRSKDVYFVPAESVREISVSTEEGSFTVTRTQEDPAVQNNEDTDTLNISESTWTLTSPAELLDSPLDQQAVSDWATYVATLNASSWLDEKTFRGDAEEAGSVRFNANGINYTVQFFETGDEGQMLCSANVSPYRFYVSRYIAQGFLKSLDELVQ